MKKIYFLCFITLSSLSITAQNCFWAHGIGGSVNDQSNAVAFDLSGNVFSTGYFSSPSIIIGSDTLKNNSGGNENFFLVKYDYTGNALWARSAAGSITNMGMAVATDQQGNSYVSGYFRASTITFGTIVLTNPNIGTAVMFIVKYDRNGNVIWATQEGGYTTNDNICNALAIDSHKNLYMTGRFHGTKIFFGVDTLFNKGGADIFIAKFDSLGNPLWARGAGGSQWDIGRSIAVDQTGNSYTTGDYISDTIRFGTTALTVHDFGTDQVFTVKYDPNGNLIWAKTFGGNQANIGMGITTDAGQVYVTGQFNSTDLTFGTTVLHLNGANNIFMVKYDANGNPLWAKGMGGTGTDWGQGIAADHKGRIHFSGSFQSSTVIFGPDTLTSAGGQSAFIAQADTAGHILNAYSPGHGITAAIAADTSGHTCFSGYFQTSQTYNGTTINSVGSYDAFVAETYPFTAPVSSFTNILCFGQTTGSATVTVSGGVSPYTYSWNSGSSASSASGLAAGPHTVQILDALGCKVKTTVMLTQPAAALTVNTTSVTVNCNTNTHGSASATPAGGTTPYTYSWNNGQTGASLSGVPAGVYTVTVTDANACQAVQSDSVKLSPVSIPPICMVTVDSLSANNVIIWDKTSFTDIDSFIVYREITTNNYQRIAAIAYSDWSEFKDTVRTKYFPNTGNPNAGTYRYKITARDSCGYYSSFSPYHNTIYIQNTGGTFSWVQLYTIENGANPVSSYVLMRDDNSTGSWHAVNSVAGTQQTVTDPSYSSWVATASWRVQTIWSITCTPTHSMLTTGLTSSYSNVLGKTVNTGIQSLSDPLQVSIYPTVGDGSFMLDASGLNSTRLNVEVYSALGMLVYQTRVNEPIANIHLPSVSSGMYFVHISGGDKQTVKRLVIE